MKKHTLSAAIALAAVSATGAFASEGSDLAPIYLDRTAISVDAGYMMDIDNLSVDSLWGGTIGMSYIFNRSEKSAHSIGLTFGLFKGNENDTYPSFSEEKWLGQIDTYSPQQKISQQIIPVIVSYKYHRNITKAISAYVGARAGVYISKTSAKTRIGSESTLIQNNNEIPFSSGYDYGESSHTSVSPVIGMELGVEYKFAKNWSWYVSGSIDASFSMDREVPAPENKNGADAGGSRDAGGGQYISDNTASQLMSRAAVCCKIRSSIDKNLINGVDDNVLRGDILGIHVVDACTVLHVVRHARRGYDEVQSKPGVAMKLRIRM